MTFSSPSPHCWCAAQPASLLCDSCLCHDLGIPDTLAVTKMSSSSVSMVPGKCVLKIPVDVLLHVQSGMTSSSRLSLNPVKIGQVFLTDLYFFTSLIFKIL